MTIAIGLAVTAASCCLGSRTIGRLRSAPAPEWTMDLRTQGFKVEGPGGPGAYQANRQIAFGSVDELVVLNDDGPFVKPNPVRAFVLEARTGRVVRTTTWTGGTHPYIHANAGGGYVTTTTEGTVVYSPGLQDVRATSRIFIRHSSPDGRSVSGWSEDTRPGHAVTAFLDSETLRPTGVYVVNTAVDSISQDRAAHEGFAGGSRGASVFALQREDDLRVYDSKCREVRPHFLSQEMLAIDGCERIDVVTLKGDRLFSWDIPYEAAFATVSRDGTRFAILEGRYSMGDPPHLCSERVTVIDVAAKGPVFTIHLRDQPRDDQGGSSGVALSPDGLLLAVNSLGLVRVYRLPAGPSTGSRPS